MNLMGKYKNTKPIAIWPITNCGGLVILNEFEEDGEEMVVAAFDCGKGYENIHTHKCQISTNGRYYIRKYGVRYYLDECIRTNL